MSPTKNSAELFEREVGAIAALDHPNILPVLRASMLEDGRSYLVMKYAARDLLQKFCQTVPQQLSIIPTFTTHDEDMSAQPAGQLQDTITSAQDEQDSQETRAMVSSPALESQLLTAQQLLPYVESAAAALHYAHEHNLIHLDVKPANLLLDGNDHLLLADFGVSVIMDGYTHASLHCYVGTPAYTAPEQWLEQPRPASDQYALAVTCYQLLTGHLPFTGNLYSIMHGHLRTPPAPLREWNPYVPEQVEAVILRAMSKEPAERYHDMLAFAAAYRGAVEQAANAQTDVQGRQRTAMLAGRERDQAIEELPTVQYSQSDTKAPAVQKGGSEAAAAPNSFDAIATIDDEVVPYRDREKLPTPSPRKPWGRLLLFLLLAFLLVSGGTLGALRVFTPCMLGVCPGLKLSTNIVNMTNSASQPVKITNTGTADLHWAIVPPQLGVSWLSYTPADGTLMAGKSTLLTITTDASHSQSSDSAVLQIGGQGVNTQTIIVKLTVQTGLSLISATGSENPFVFDQSGLHPGAQTITITNGSSQSFNWYVSYKYANSWLQVSPEQGSVAAGGKGTLNVNANLQSLLPLPSKAETYLAAFTILGSLGQSDPGILSQFSFTLEVKPVAPTVTPPVTTTPQTPVFPPLTLNAQSPQPLNAPGVDRSGHDMVWDATDDLFYVFGGIDGAGNLLNDLWSYSPLTNQWSQINSPASASSTCADGTWPAPRMNAAMVWDSIHRQILLYGGIGANNRYLGDLWSYSPSANTGTWTPIACLGNGPGARAANAVWNGSQMLLVGGIDKYGPLADFWSYTPDSGSAGSWQRLGDFPAGPRAYQTLVWDSTDNQLFAFGGIDLSLTQRADFYSYSAGAGWKAIAPASASNPLARQQGMGVWDSKDDKLLLMGGWNDNDPKGPYWGLWAYDPGTNLWDLLTPLDAAGNHIIPGRTDSTMVWDAREQEAFIYAGAGNGKSGSTLNDLWAVTSG